MGKSAVLFHVIDRLNDGWDQTYFEDRKVAAIYVYAGTDWNQIGHICIDAMRRLEGHRHHRRGRSRSPVRGLVGNRT
jgi:hypothetical protein